MSYKKLVIVLVISFIIMYGVMFLNVDKTDHIYLSATRTYMALLMSAPMAVVMIVLMGKMFPDKKLNTTMLLRSIVVFGLVLAGLCTQTLLEMCNI